SYPNPSSDEVYVSYKLHTRAVVNLSLLDTKGNVIKRIITDEKKGYGIYVERIDPSKIGISSGVYFLQLKVDDTVMTTRQVIIK
ncbi:MAG TPA: T9SS type A sorting domain-containing protein, partial [Saprospiraceae bacterium]|nr:T9SS type A sorting domain-containing protein [Saprospiraceae bacterium]